uniref:Proliferating cell nuclear antigen n=1 Tax=Panagrolaimus sp. ES5 TaxID=591445 RepID=A0AC34F2N5_9BILA
MSLLDADLEASEDIFTAQCDNPAEVLLVLRALEFKEKPKLYCTVSIDKTGMKFVVESHKSFQGRAFFDHAFFSEWDLRSDVVLIFCIGLRDFMAAIGCLSTKNSVIKLTMEDEKTTVKDRRLNIFADDGKFKANLSLPVFNTTSDEYDFRFYDVETIAEIKLEAKTIKSVFREIDIKEYPTITFSFQPNRCCISTKSETGKVSTLFTKGSRDAIQIICDGDSFHFKYRSIFIKRLKYATNNASKVSLAMNDNGILRVQVCLAKIDQHSAFIEFYTIPVVEAREM